MRQYGVSGNQKKMNMLGNTNISFDNEFDLVNRKFDEIEIKETYDKSKCLIWDRKDNSKCYNSFLLKENSQSKIICEICFYLSSKTKKYIPRPVFKRVSKDGNIKSTKSQDKVIISFIKSEDATVFWKLISFIKKYKDIVDLGDLESTFKVVAKDSYFIEFNNKSDKEKAEDILALVKNTNLSSTDMRSITFESRKKDLKLFYYLLLNKDYQGKKIHDLYRDKHSLGSGLETIWHYFLRNHDWILGLNLDILFIKDFLDEQKLGVANSKGLGSPQTDLIGISEFTTLVELKHPNTDIFKKTVNKGRANTWDFTSGFIEGVSQCLGQKDEITRSYDAKTFIKNDGSQLDKRTTFNLDPDAVFVVGCKNREFPIHDYDNKNITKYKTFHRFRRNVRNVTIITFDELFERAFYSVYSIKLPIGWYNDPESFSFK